MLNVQTTNEIVPKNCDPNITDGCDDDDGERDDKDEKTWCDVVDEQKEIRLFKIRIIQKKKWKFFFAYLA